MDQRYKNRKSLSFLIQLSIPTVIAEFAINGAINEAAPTCDEWAKARSG